MTTTGQGILEGPDSSGKGLPDSGKTARTFPNLLQVLEYLRKAGWKISQPGIYKHRHEGKIVARKDGTFGQVAVEKYARTFLRRADGSRAGQEVQEQQQRKAAEETRKISAQADLAELKAKALQGALVPRESRDSELAAKAAIFRTDGENWIHAEASGIIDVCRGDQTYLPDVIAHMLAGLESWLARYVADMDFIPPSVSATDRALNRALADATDTDPDFDEEADE